MTRNGSPESRDLCKCGHCGFTASIDDFDCGGLPDGMVFCPKCLSIIEAETGAVIKDDDLELRCGEL